MQSKKQQIENQITLIQKQLSAYPEGKLICARNGKYTKWYLSDGKNKIYIPKTERRFAEKMAMKRYLMCQLEDLKQEFHAIDFYLKHHINANGKADQLLDKNSEYFNLLSENFQPLSQQLKEWMNSPYVKSEKYPENLKVKTISGNYVRSKSEMLIDTILQKYQIPYRYECQLKLGDVILYPDYTIMHPKTGKLFFWEHFGMMDDPKYGKSATEKLSLFISNGIYPTIQLITTYETQDHPLSIDTVEKIVEEYFL